MIVEDRGTDHSQRGTVASIETDPASLGTGIAGNRRTDHRDRRDRRVRLRTNPASVPTRSIVAED